MLPDLSDRQWLWCAAGLYAAGLLLGTVSLVRGQRTSGVLIYCAILAGYVLQFIGLGVRGRATGGCPLGNQFEIFQFTAWSAITLYLVVGVTFRSSVLGFFTSCLGAALTVVSLSIPAWDAVRRTHIFGGNPWIELHAALAIFSYGVFGLLALASGLFLLRHFSLKSKRLGGWFSFLPSILDLDHIEMRLLAAGFGLLTLALAFGSVYWSRDTGVRRPRQAGRHGGGLGRGRGGPRAEGRGAPPFEAVRLGVPRAFCGGAHVARGGRRKPAPGRIPAPERAAP